MKKVLAALCAALVIALSVALTGCGADNSAQAKAAFAGSWKIVAMEQDGEDMGSEYISMMEDLNIKFGLELKDDGTAEFTVASEVMSGKWEAKSTTEGSITIDNDTVPMKISDGKLVLEESGSKMTFEKADKK